MVDIDFELLSKAMREHVRNKARAAGSTIVYEEDGVLIEEDPQTSIKKILGQAAHYSPR